MTALKYQPEIDGLRAIAVVPVVLFHAGIPAFGGGFVGVDVFFVISGYLITGIIATDLEAGRFSLLNFYERRVRRLMPALLATLLATLAAALWLFLPYQLAALSRASIATLAFVSNIWFWSHSGYFAGTAALEPLLHTWSLAVEEQYYLFFPVGLWLLSRWRVPLLPVILAVLTVSLALSVVLVTRIPSATFYLLPTRAWELMTGAALSLGAVPAVRSRGLREGLCAAGLVLIAWPVFAYGPETPFPGAAALPPCLGAAAIILAGRDGGGTVPRLVGSRPMVAIGLISYSLYLWHWPLLVFSRQFLAVSHLPMPVAAAAIVAALLIAWASWRWIETPFRSRTRIPRLRLFRIAAASVLGAAAAASLTASGLPGRFDPVVQRLASGKDDVPETIGRCLKPTAAADRCAIGAEGTPSFAIWGDSHAAALASGVALAARQARRTGLVFAFNGCPPGRGSPSPTLIPPDQARCRERNGSVEHEILADRRIDTVILAAYWGKYLEMAPGPLLVSLGRTIKKLRQAGKRVVVLAGIPAPGVDVPFMLAVTRARGAPLQPVSAGSGVDARLQAVAVREGARLVSLSPAFCSRGVCRLEVDGRPLFMDSNHVSEFANVTFVAPFLAKARVFDP